MNYKFARIQLDYTNYTPTVFWAYLDKTDYNIAACEEIYRQYCTYKKFASVMPLFRSRFHDVMADVIGYWDQTNLVAFSLIRRFDETNALCDQFAWTYHNPDLHLGIETLKTECAIYKQRGFVYLYLEQAQLYKSQLNGFELLGPIT